MKYNEERFFGLRKGILVIISSPSGAGKTSVTRSILEKDSRIIMSISATTREKRPNEKEGIDYHFLSSEEFDNIKKNDGFLEYAKVFGNNYGTPLKFVEENLEKGLDIIFDIDWQGARQIEKKMTNIVKIFILPPSLTELRQRLINRASDDEEVVVQRMKKANNEISHWPEYDYLIVNDNLSETIEKVMTIINCERMKHKNYPDAEEFIESISNNDSE